MVSGRSKEKNRKGSAGLRIIAAAVCLFFAAAGIQASAVQVETLTVTVGYFGDQQFEKDRISLNDLADKCGTGEEIYTWINKSGKPGTTEAVGIYVGSILDYYGVDRSEVESYNFYVDSQAGSYDGNTQEWRDEALFGPRYTVRSSFEEAVAEFENADREDFLLNPESYFTINDIYDFSEGRYTQQAWSSREPVEPMLALQRKNNTWAGYTPGSNLDFSDLNDSESPVLMFGQSGANEAGRMLQAQMVSHLHIRYSGSPKIVLTTDQQETEVGKSTRVNAEVQTPDEDLTRAIAGQIQIKSSNDKVAVVNPDGSVTITGEGAADIVAMYNGKEVGRVSLTGRGGNSDQQEEKPSENKPSKDEDPGKTAEGGENGDKKDNTEAATEAKNGDGSGSGSASGDGDGSGGGGNTRGAGGGKGDKDATGRGSGEKDAAGKQIAKSEGNKKGTDSKSADRQQAGLSRNSDRSATVSPRAPTLSTTSAGAQTRREDSGSDGGASSGSGDSNVKVYKISEAENAYVERAITPGLLRTMGGAAGAAIALGIGVEGIYYRRQTDWQAAAKKAFERRKI